MKTANSLKPTFSKKKILFFSNQEIEIRRKSLKKKRSNKGNEAQFGKKCYILNQYLPY